MKSMISPPSSTAASTTFHHRLNSPANSTTLLRVSPSRNRLFHRFTGDIKFAELPCKAIYEPTNKDVLHQSDVPFVHEHLANVTYSQEVLFPNNDVKGHIKAIKSIFDAMEDGVITPSAYDVAWVALIRNVNGSIDGPQFPSCLEWIVNHQLPDGSWGDSLIFSAHDRILNTLACVVALTYWSVHHEKCQKGTNFVNENMHKLRDEKEEHMTIGFEIVFPNLIELARKLEINNLDDSLVLKEIYTRRDLKLAKIPKNILHETPTSLLYSIEGMENLECAKLLKLQCKSGSFFFSPSATAFVFMQTKDQKCSEFLTNLVDKFNGGVPHTYPVDLFEHIWMIDRLQRLGISRYFLSEINRCVSYIYRYWTEQGIGFGRHSNVPDTDDTAMGFRVLRMNGYKVSADVFGIFEKDGEFVSFPGQTTQALTGTFNLYRASQLLFPGEKILDDAKKFSRKFLMEKRATNELLDKWIIAKDLPGEIGYALDVPWYASLPRLEARYYLEQYGGEDDVWIGKTFYRMKNINNNKYLEMAKLDYNHCQALHQLEWSHIQKWYANLNIEESINSRLLWSYYEAAASIFEPDRCNERLAWVKTTVLLNIITSFFVRPQFSNADKQAFVDEFTNPQRHPKDEKSWHVMLNALHKTLNQISSDALVAHGIDIYRHLHRAWTSWLLSWQEKVDNIVEGEAELVVQTINMSSGQWLSHELLSHPLYLRLSSVINELCYQISNTEDCTIGFEIESKMQELVQLVLCDSQDNNLDIDLKQTFLTVAKTYYYRKYFDSETINEHINRVLFENVI